MARVTVRETEIINLLLQGCDNKDIARELHIAERTVKAHFNRLFLRFKISDGLKRVKLATLLYRRQLWTERMETQSLQARSNVLQFLLPGDLRTKTSESNSTPPNTLSRIASE